MILKICGLTDPEQALACARLGATAIGVNLWPGSRRAVPQERAAAIFAALRAEAPAVLRVALFVNPTPAEVLAAAAALPFSVAQLHGDEPPGFAREIGLLCWKGLRIASESDLARVDLYGVAGPPPWQRLVIDAPSPGYGGSGRTLDLDLAARAAARHPVILAGGLTPENVAARARAVRPVGVDVASGVEEAPGRKDLDKVAAFLEAARAALRRRE